MNVFASTDIEIDLTEEESEVLSKAAEILEELEKEMWANSETEQWAFKPGHAASDIREILDNQFD